jgi:hypothetical protein
MLEGLRLNADLATKKLKLLSLLQNDDFRSKLRPAKNFFRRHIIDIPRIKI